MKISIGSKITHGAYGGGNSFLQNLTNQLIQDGHTIVNDLKDKDIDIILLTNPLITSETSTYNNFDIDFYQNFINKKSISIHRINECDERKNTNFVNKKILSSNKYIDINVFVSNWLKNLYEGIGIDPYKSFVIKGGPSKDIFNFKNSTPWNKKEKLKIVTHHWSSNENKGSKIYKQLDEIVGTNQDIEFTYIGNYPNNIKFKNTKYIPPLSGKDLADELSRNHVYITGSLNEPSGNHHMEAAMCRLPILYVYSGALPEYCSEIGVAINEANLEDKIYEMKNKYDLFYEKLLNYKWDFDNAYSEFKEILNYIELNRDLILKRRQNVTKIRILINYLFNKVCVLIYKRFQKIRIVLGKIKKYILR